MFWLLMFIEPELGYVKLLLGIMFYVTEFHWAEVVEGLGSAFNGCQKFLESLLCIL